MVGFLTVIISGTLGVILGLFAGYYRGKVDSLLSRAAADIQLSIPTIIMAIVLLAMVGPSVFNIIMVMAISRWTLYFRLVRGIVLSLMTSPMIDAARVIGVSRTRLFYKHLLANLWTPIIVVSTQQMAQMILLEATLSFLGVGIPPSVPSWGMMVAQEDEHPDRLVGDHVSGSGDFCDHSGHPILSAMGSGITSTRVAGFNRGQKGSGLTTREDRNKNHGCLTPD